jgi:hypothetical protein
MREQLTLVASRWRRAQLTLAVGLSSGEVGRASDARADSGEPACSFSARHLPGHHSGLMLAVRITSPPFSVSDARCLPKSNGEPANGRGALLWLGSIWTETMSRLAATSSGGFPMPH